MQKKEEIKVDTDLRNAITVSAKKPKRTPKSTNTDPPPEKNESLDTEPATPSHPDAEKA